MQLTDRLIKQFIIHDRNSINLATLHAAGGAGAGAGVTYTVNHGRNSSEYTHMMAYPAIIEPVHYDNSTRQVNPSSATAATGGAI